VRTLLFRLRGFTPLPFLALALYFAEPYPFRIALGAMLALAGEWLRIVSIRYAGGATRTREVGAPSLVTDGPYAVTRNPLYSANMMLYTGFALASGALFPCLPVICLLWFAMQYALIISLEEKTLALKFGREYEDYRLGIPRLFPKLSATKSTGKPKHSLGEALREERRTLQGFAAAWILLILRMSV
jgi:protein-S-isoprenylcysteine O-methyltransferase Ste14